MDFNFVYKQAGLRDMGKMVAIATVVVIVAIAISEDTPYQRPISRRTYSI